MTAPVMPPAYATGICATHVRAADARRYARTNERTDVDNYSPCEDILLLSNAGAKNPISLGGWAENQTPTGLARCPNCGPSAVAS